MEEYKSTILVVDDRPEGRRLLERLLSIDDYHLAFASNGQEALEQAAALTPDVILLDVMMPEMDGFETCRRLRANPRLAEVPVIMVTALDDRASRLKGIEAGADDFVSKPFDPSELRARVTNIIRLNRYRRLLLERAKFEWVVEQCEDAYVMVNHQGGILYANSQVRHYFDLPLEAESAITGTFQEISQKLYHQKPQEAWANWPAPSDAQRYLVRPETPTARACWLQVDVQALPYGVDIGRVIRLRDVTEQMTIDNDIRTFHSVINHKLRTPVTHILSSMEILTNLAPNLSKDEMVNLAETAYKGVRRFYNQVEDILKYLEAPSLAQPGAGFHIHQLPAMVEQISANLGLENVSVSGCQSLANDWTTLSERALEMAFWEILENTAKFHPQKAPTVKIEVYQAEARRIKIQIYDNGLTLTPEQLAYVWTLYYQGEKYFTGEVTGMGLGLPTVFRIINNAGGSCRIYNREDGPGVVVELILPTVERII